MKRLIFSGSRLDILCIVPAYKIMHAQNMKYIIGKYTLNIAKQTRTLFMTVLTNSVETKWQKQSENAGAGKLDSVKLLCSTEAFFACNFFQVLKY